MNIDMLKQLAVLTRQGNFDIGIRTRFCQVGTGLKFKLLLFHDQIIDPHRFLQEVDQSAGRGTREAFLELA